MGQAFYNAEGILTGVSGIPGVTGPDPSGVGSYNPLYDQSLSAEEKQNIRNQQQTEKEERRQALIAQLGIQDPLAGNQRGNQGMFGNPYMQRPMFGGGFGGGFNPYQQRSMFGGGFNPTGFNPSLMYGGGFGGFGGGFNPYQQLSMFGGGFNPTGFNPSPMYGGGFNPYQQRSGNRFPQNVDLGGIQALINQMQRRQAQQAFQRPIQVADLVPTRGEEMVNTAGNSGAADAARAAATAQFSGIPQGLGGTAQFQTQPVSTGAADAARAMATAQFSGDPRQRGMDNLFSTVGQNIINSGGTTAPAPATTPTTVPFSGQYMNTGAGGGIVPAFGLNPMNQQAANTNPGAGGGIVPAFGLNPMNQQGAGNTASAGGGTI